MNGLAPRLENIVQGLPPRFQELARTLYRPARARLHHPRWGNLRRPAPFTDRDRLPGGMSVERAYLERFISSNCDVLRGNVLEAGRHEWTTAVNWQSVDKLEVVDLDPTNDRMTLVGDICDPTVFTGLTFDCAILLQVLQRVAFPERALTNVWRSLKPRGALLVSVPGIHGFGQSEDVCDRWRWTPTEFRRLLTKSFPSAQINVHTFGSLASVTAHLYGLSVTDLGARAMTWDDPRYPVVLCARLDRRNDD